jgi:Fe-S-cluster containining protein
MSTPNILGYECDRCGACCKALIVEADVIDVLREPRILECQMNSLPTLKQLIEEPEMRSVVLSTGKGCHFLQPDNMCSIYPTRPSCCVGVLAGDAKCQQARSASDLPPLQPIVIGEITIEDFNAMYYGDPL